MRTPTPAPQGGALRAALRGAALSYRALFTWFNPLGYLSSRIVRPIGMAIAFTSLATHYGAGADRMMIASSLLAGAGAVVYGMALSIGNERSFNTLGAWLASPQNKVAAAGQRALPHIVDGFVGGLCTYLVCALLYMTLPIGVPQYALLLAVGVLTTAGFGLTLSAVALLLEDLFVGPNMAELVLMVLSGTLVPQDRLPAFLVPLSRAMPLSHVMEAVDGLLAGRPHGTPLLVELAVGGAWALAGVLFVHLAARRATTRLALGTS
ncbi:ABC transporter permease [Streptomyces abyssomicinicus]|uniref:ABC transporter permease n=1 Tax=Streptomyces abyssomicinicus TaxID=574929 RepID=UPI00124FCAA5|nr:ABC transporter permease [Streptomyces abyssomicinicus]